MPGTYLNEELTAAQPVKPVLASTDVSPPLQPQVPNLTSEALGKPLSQGSDTVDKSAQLKQFLEDDRHFNLARCACLLVSPKSPTNGS